MSFAFRYAAATMLVVAATVVARSFSAEPSDPPRTSQQRPNRMLCITTQGKDHVFVDMPRHFDVGSPSISPDSKWIAFDALTLGGRAVRESWLVGLDGKGLRKVADGATPRWSPDSRSLLLTRKAPPEKTGDSGAESNVFEHELASGKVRKICAGRLGDWSPDGTRIAVARQGAPTSSGGTPTSPSIFICKADGSDVKELGEGNWPSWSPDGTKIACCIQEKLRTPVLWIIEVESKKRTKLGYGFYRAQWSADSKSVVCAALFVDDYDRPYRKDPARYWLDKPGKPVVFHADLDNPWSPCESRDGKTAVLVVDSAKHGRPADVPVGGLEK